MITIQEWKEIQTAFDKLQEIEVTDGVQKHIWIKKISCIDLLRKFLVSDDKISET